MIQRLIEDCRRKGIISEEDEEIYAYGLRQGLFQLLNCAVILLVGCLFQVPLKLCIMMFVYVAMRVYAGGYHAETPAKCLVWSIILYGISAWLIRMAGSGGIIWVTVFMVSALCIYILSPVPAMEKPVSDEEARYFRKKVIVRGGIFLVTALILRISGLKEISFNIELAFVALAVMLIAGKAAAVHAERSAIYNE